MTFTWNLFTQVTMSLVTEVETLSMLKELQPSSKPLNSPMVIHSTKAVKVALVN